MAQAPRRKSVLILGGGDGMASVVPLTDRPMGLPAGLKYLSPEVWQAAQVFDFETGALEVSANTLQSHAFVGCYLDGWAHCIE